MSSHVDVNSEVATVIPVIYSLGEPDSIPANNFLGYLRIREVNERRGQAT